MKIKIPGQERTGRPARRRTTTITFTEDDLVAIGRLVSVGQTVLQSRAPVVARLKAAHGRFLVRRGSPNVGLTTTEVLDRSRHLETGGLLPLPLGGGYVGLYEVLRYQATLELLDPGGETALLEREQELRILQDGV